MTTKGKPMLRITYLNSKDVKLQLAIQSVEETSMKWTLVPHGVKIFDDAFLRSLYQEHVEQKMTTIDVIDFLKFVWLLLHVQW